MIWDREQIARAIYSTHWKAADPEAGRAGTPVWENASEAVKDWVRAQADSVLAMRCPLYRWSVDPDVAHAQQVVANAVALLATPR